MKIFKGILVALVLLVAVVMLNGSGKALKNDTNEEKNEKMGKIVESHIVQNGYMIIEGRLFEPPFEVTLRPNGIWVEDVLYQKIEIPVDPKKEKIQIEEKRVMKDLYYRYIDSTYIKDKKKSKAQFLNASKEYKGYKFKSMDKNKIIFKSPYDNDIVIDLTEIKKFGFTYCHEYYLGSACLNLLMKYIYDKNKKSYKELITILDNEKKRKIVKNYQITAKQPPGGKKHVGLGMSLEFYSGNKDLFPIPEPLTEKEKKRRAKQLKELKKNHKTPEEELKESYFGLCKTLENGDYIFKCGGGGEIGNSGKIIVEKIKKVLEDDSLKREEKIKKIRKYYSGYGECVDTLINTYKRKKK